MIRKSRGADDVPNNPNEIPDLGLGGQIISVCKLGVSRRMRRLLP